MNEEKTFPKEYYITKGTLDTNNLSHGIPIHTIIGKIEMINNDEGNRFAELLESGEFGLSPYGYGTKNENGVITDFNLVGFNLTRK